MFRNVDLLLTLKILKQKLFSLKISWNLEVFDYLYC